MLGGWGMDVSLINEIIPWICEFAFFLGLLPQIFLNYKIKSASGISDLYLVGYFTGYFINIFYVYGCDFPLSYKVFVPLCLLAVVFLIFQKFLYSNLWHNVRALKLYFTDFIILFLLVPLMFYFPQIVGHVSGWLLIIIWTLYQFPQIFSIYRKKSVRGFSFMLVTLIGLGNLVEFIVAIVLDLPMQTFLISFRGMLIYLIFCLEFWWYSKDFRFVPKMNFLKTKK